MNTQFRKTEDKKATYRRPGVDKTAAVRRPTHEQLDYILTTNRWKNTVKNAEADNKANIDTDHAPVIATIQIKLKGTKKNTKQRKTYGQYTEKEREEANTKIAEQFSVHRSIPEEHRNDKATETHIMEIIKLATKELPQEKAKERRDPLSKQAEEILNERKRAIETQNAEQFEELTRQFKKQKRKDKTEQILETLDKDLDCRDQWLGIRRIKTEYKPNPYHRSTKDGKHIRAEERAEEAAKYLHKHQWGRKEVGTNQEEEQNRKQWRTDKIIREDTEYDTSKIKLEELKLTIKKFKRRKAPGPDEIPMEIYKELNDENLTEISKIINIWWESQELPEEQLRARVVLIYKK